MSKIKKALFFLAAGTAIFLMAGCHAKTSAAQKNFSIDSAPVKKGTIAVYVPQGKNENYITKAAELYNKKNHASLKLKITNVTPGGSTTQMISPKLVAHEEMPEIIFIQDTNAAGILQLFSESFLSASKFGFYDKYREQFYAPKIATLDEISGGKDKAMAWPNDYGVAVSYYQPELFDAIGAKFEDIKSWDEMIDAGIRIKNKTGHKLMGLIRTGEVEQVSAIMDQQGVPLFDKKGNINLASSAAENSAEILQKMIDNDLIAWCTDNNAEKVKQTCALNLTGSFYATNMEMNFPSAANKWRMARFVPYSEENPGKTPANGGSSWYVTKDSKNSLAAGQLLTFMLTDPDALAISLESGLSISNRTAFETPAAEKKFDYYGGQQILKIIAQENENGAAVNIYPYSTDSRGYIASACYEYWKNQDFKKSYVKSAEDFAHKHSLKVNHD